MDLKDVMGDAFESKYRSGGYKKANLSEDDYLQIKKMIAQGEMDASTGSMIYLKDSGRVEIVLVEVKGEPQVYPTKNEEFVRMRGISWMGKWIQTFVSPDVAPVFESGNNYFLIGNMRTGTWQGKESLSFFARKVISLEEIAVFREEMNTLDVETVDVKGDTNASD